jgi:hypothetical protein
VRREESEVRRQGEHPEGGDVGAFLTELWAFMRERKKFWLLPVIMVLLLFGALIVLTEGSAVAPFIYTLF